MLVSDARHSGRMQRATYRNQLERLEVSVAAVACARERLLYAQASCAYTVGYVDDAREFLELPEERLRDQRVIARLTEGLLCRIGANTTYDGSENHEIM